MLWDLIYSSVGVIWILKLLGKLLAMVKPNIISPLFRKMTHTLGQLNIQKNVTGKSEKKLVKILAGLSYLEYV